MAANGLDFGAVDLKEAAHSAFPSVSVIGEGAAAVTVRNWTGQAITSVALAPAAGAADLEDPGTAASGGTATAWADGFEAQLAYTPAGQALTATTTAPRYLDVTLTFADGSAAVMHSVELAGLKRAVLRWDAEAEAAYLTYTGLGGAASTLAGELAWREARAAAIAEAERLAAEAEAARIAAEQAAAEEAARIAAEEAAAAAAAATSSSYYYYAPVSSGSAPVAQSAEGCTTDAVLR
jgi:hypothetical protein